MCKEPFIYNVQYLKSGASCVKIFESGTVWQSTLLKKNYSQDFVIEEGVSALAEVQKFF